VQLMKFQFKTTTLILIVTLLLCPLSASAQKPESKTTEEAALKAKAFELLESLSTQLTNLQSAENRARLGANIADSLWPHDEKRARALFTTVGEDIKVALVKSYEKPIDYRTLSVFRKLRLDTTERIGKHDADFAYTFLTATEPPPLTDYMMRPQQFEIDSERMVQIRLAKKVAQNNPEIAVKLAKQSLERGFERDLVSLLLRLHRKQREEGVALYKETVARLAKVNMAHDWRTTSFVILLVEAVPPPLADEASYRELINSIITNAIANNCKSRDYHSATYFCNQIRQLSVQMTLVDRQRTSQFINLPTNREDEDLQSLSVAFEIDEVMQSGGSIDEVLALAQKYPEIADPIYQRAAQFAQSSGDTDRARKIIKEFIKDSRLQQRLLANLDRTEIEKKISDEEFDERLREINALPNTRSRIEFLARLATDTVATDKDKALKLLDQATSLADELKPGSEQAELRLGVAISYCTMKSDRGLALIEADIPKLNELIAAAIKLDGFDTRYLRDGEWIMSAEGKLGQLLTSFSESAATFARCDFERAVNLAAQFERAEIRIMAQVKLAQGILSGPPRSRRYQSFEIIEH
jgi:hypothetical protein